MNCRIWDACSVVWPRERASGSGENERLVALAGAFRAHSVWPVKRSDPFVWPINEGMGADLPDDERLQLFSAFWNVAYHAIFHLDFYLWDGASEYAPPAPFLESDHHGNRLPARAYAKDELLDYLEHGRRKSVDLFKNLTDEQAASPWWRGGTFAGLLLGNLLHVREHAAQLNLFLNTR